MSFPDIPAALQRKWTNTPAHAQPETQANTYTPHPLFQNTHTFNRIFDCFVSLSFSLSLSPHYLFPFSPSSGMFLHFLSRMQIGRNTDQNLLQNGALLRGKKEGCAVKEEGGGGGGGGGRPAGGE